MWTDKLQWKKESGADTIMDVTTSLCSLLCILQIYMSTLCVIVNILLCLLHVGAVNKDHACWERPEDMDTPRNVYKIDMSSPGSGVAAETAAASLVFKRSGRVVVGCCLANYVEVNGWDNKHTGARILLSKTFLVQKVQSLHDYKGMLRILSLLLYQGPHLSLHPNTPQVLEPTFSAGCDLCFRQVLANMANTHWKRKERTGLY